MTLNRTVLIAAAALFAANLTSSTTWAVELYTVTDLGTLGGNYSYAYGINANGQVVGDSGTASGKHAFLYSSSTMMDLNSLITPSSGWMLEAATSINDLGQIVGQGYINGQYHAYLLTPVPEPTALSLLALGGLALARRRAQFGERDRIVDRF